MPFRIGTNSTRQILERKGTLLSSAGNQAKKFIQI